MSLNISNRRIIMTPALASGNSDAPQTSAFLARTSGLSLTETNAYKALINGMVLDGTFSLMRAFYIFATNNTTTAALNLASTSFGITANGSLTFTADQGWAGDGSTGWLDTGFTASISGMSLNSASLGIYDRTSNSSASFASAMGVSDAAGTARLILQPQNGTGPFATNFALNDNAFVSLTCTNSQGLWIASRTISSQDNLFLDGVAVSGSPVSATSSTLPDQTMPICASRSLTGVVGNFSNDQFAAAFIGDGLTTTRMASVSARINAYMTAIGANVY
jgi:hypothetical protein